MNHNDERDYAEEAANRRDMESEKESESRIPDYVYHRAGETFTVGPNGIRYVAADGSVVLTHNTEIPPDVIASTVVDLALAGWTPEGLG